MLIPDTKSTALIVEYDGSNYFGWQRQKKENSVQQEIESALQKIFGIKFSIIAAGRTDTGVHSYGQVCSFINQEQIKITEEKLAAALNFYLPNDIRIIKAKYLDFPFHARFDAIAREYIYKIALVPSVFSRKYSYHIKYKLDFELLQAASKLFLGEKDFSTFSKFNNEVKNHICNIIICDWRYTFENNIELKIKANRFLYGMVRQCVGAMIDVARKKINLDELKRRMDAADRKFCFPSAPANGLFLSRIYYPDDIQKALNFTAPVLS